MNSYPRLNNNVPLTIVPTQMSVIVSRLEIIRDSGVFTIVIMLVDDILPDVHITGNFML